MKYETIIGLTLFGIGSSIIVGVVASKNDYLLDPSPITYVQTVPAREKSTPRIIVSASWYGQEYCDKYSPACIAADGSRFDDTKLTAACDRRWPLGTVLSLTYSGKTIQVRCTDRGNFAKYGRQLDLSKASFRALAPLSQGVIKVEVKNAGLK